MLPELATFQKAFADAVMADGQPDPQFRSQAFAVYRNTSVRGAVEALRASYPTIDALLGPDMFTAVALDYRRETPPASPVLSEYGIDFPDWLRRQPWTSELPYAADVARLDRLWLECFLAGGAETLPRSISSGPRIALHPAARFVWLNTPALTVWQAHRDGFDELDLEWREEGALFTRPGLAVRVEQIEPACHRLLLTCAISIRVDECVARIADAFPEADIPQLLQRCVSSGALVIQ